MRRIASKPSIQFFSMALRNRHLRFIRSDAVPQILSKENLFRCAQSGNFRNIVNAHFFVSFLLASILSLS